MVECSLILLRDMQFVGEDSALTDALTRRLPPPDTTRRLPPPDTSQVSMSTNVSSAQPLHADLDDIWNLLLRDNDTRRAHAYEKDPTEEQIEILALKMMEQSCYSTQYRLKDVSSTIREYEEHPLFRMAHSFKQLEEWEWELHSMYSFTMNSSRASPATFRIARHIVYFTHAVRKMIDVTYTVEYVIHLHNNVLAMPIPDLISG